MIYSSDIFHLAVMLSCAVSPVFPLVPGEVATHSLCEFPPLDRVDSSVGKF